MKMASYCYDESSGSCTLSPVALSGAVVIIRRTRIVNLFGRHL